MKNGRLIGPSISFGDNMLSFDPKPQARAFYTSDTQCANRLRLRLRVKRSLPRRRMHSDLTQSRKDRHSQLCVLAALREPSQFGCGSAAFGDWLASIRCDSLWAENCPRPVTA